MAAGKHLGLANELEREILSGKYGWEGGLPSASDLAQTWNLSLNTVKSALAVLEGKSLVEKRGIGYYVTRVPISMTQYVPPTHIRRKDGYCKNIGSVQRVTVPAHLAEKLQISPSQAAVYRVQISGETSNGNEKPLQICYRYDLLPISDEKTQQMQDDPTYEPMWKEANVQVELSSYDENAARMATKGETDLLNLPEVSPVLHVLEIIRDKD